MSDSYKQAGVNLEAGYEVVSRIKKHVKRRIDGNCQTTNKSYGIIIW